ncbi:MAG TPA: hypothetical protein VGH11_13520 [Jatrophihabitans sp.]|jgi:hypothetical protein
MIARYVFAGWLAGKVLDFGTSCVRRRLDARADRQFVRALQRAVAAELVR